MTRALLAATLLLALLAACQEPGLTRTVIDGVECFHYGSTGYTSCQPVEPLVVERNEP